jgi:hypothetical protein
MKVLALVSTLISITAYAAVDSIANSSAANGGTIEIHVAQPDVVTSHTVVNSSTVEVLASPRFLAAERSESVGSPSFDKTEADMETALTNLMLGNTKFGATPMGDSVKQISNLILKEMMPKVIAAHQKDQTSLEQLAQDISKCGSTKSGDLKKASPAQKSYMSYSKLHRSCRQEQAVEYTSKDSCMQDQRGLYRQKVLQCNYFAQISKKFGTQKDNHEIVKKAGGEKTEQYIRRISSTICGNHIHGEDGDKSRKGGLGGGLPNSFLDQYLQAKEKCQKGQKEYASKVKECKTKSAQYQVTRGKCNQYQMSMDSESCKHAVMVKDTCEAYTGCYSTKKSDYERHKRKAAAEEVDRKAEWRGLKRMECLIKAFADGKVSGPEVESCKKKSHDTTHLDIKYPKIPPPAKCKLPTLYPSTGAYKRREFKPLPSLAKGLQSFPCSGMDTVPTTPRSGSPKGAMCERVPLLGPYSAGALIKCTGGFDARRSKDKNSCPRGTKIFSPASRSDWKTVLASTDPLRDPNWIIDITRPQNSCGGCTSNPMNWQNRRQETWTTSDGSPWWLRSTRYSEPNGDYSANCFLDLWHGKPRNENEVIFNDHKCNYHSKSYYCQPVHVPLKPKSGSPKSCKCSKVDLTGKYTAGVLVKCAQCIDVYKSTQKNSCPAGMKIFSPASRGDWKTVLDSAGPLRAPHWIIDVTRPQQGCGGCKKFSMKSTTPQQSTWRTSDGSPWWLRSTTYSEPNGNYAATCYLGLNGYPKSPDTLQFDDNGCRFHSRSYYCQPSRSDKNYGGHHRRRRESLNRKAPDLTCPSGTTQVGDHNADMPGCGLEACKDRYKVKTAEACREKCMDDEDCKSITWAPKGGDRNHMDDYVCTMYSETKPTKTWGPNQVFCRMPPKVSWFCVASISRKSVTGSFRKLEDAKTELNKRKGSANNRQMICEMTRHGAKSDPHKVGGENQGGGSKAGFQKWWWNWDDIHRMNKMCDDQAACSDRPK